MNDTVLLIHGRSKKPSEPDLSALWTEALLFGLKRDQGSAGVKQFNSLNFEFVYYGDLSNAFLDPDVNLNSQRDFRGNTLDGLKDYSRGDFVGSVGKEKYQSLPGRTSLKEAFADSFGALLGAIRFAPHLIRSVAPDVHHYWTDSEFGSQVRHRMIAPLKRAMNRKGRILVVSHSLGTIVSYDTFWKFSRMGEYRPRYTDKKIDLWITLGSPLADETIKRELKGARAEGSWKYPANIERWVNFAAHDDFISHDQRVANDYREMVRTGLCQSIEDIRLYNLALRKGKSNPHSSLGYLVHPLVIKEISSWLAAAD